MIYTTTQFQCPSSTANQRVGKYYFIQFFTQFDFSPNFIFHLILFFHQFYFSVVKNLHCRSRRYNYDQLGIINRVKSQPEICSLYKKGYHQHGAFQSASVSLNQYKFNVHRDVSPSNSVNITSFAGRPLLTTASSDIQ